jgi:CheY-like chemotaxis protein/nitrogen-specific signal transduction histidine kinase
MDDRSKEKRALEKQLTICQQSLEALKKEFEARQHQDKHTLANLLHGISQDIIMPLNGILASCQKSGGVVLEKPTNGNPGVIHSVNYLMTLVQGLSVFGSLLKNDVRTEKREFSVNDLFRELIGNNQPMAAMVKVDIQKAFYSDLPARVESDYSLIRQIISGFLSNALKNTKEGTVILSAEIIKRDKDALLTRLMVSDSGKGMSEEHQNHIRNDLEQREEKGLMMTENIGLGLILAKNLAQKLGGAFGFKSDKGVGSSFWVDLPLREIKDSVPVSRSEKHPFQTAKKRKILLVEDNYLNQKFVAAALLKAGHSIEIAENGKVALEKYRSKQYDLILMDIQLPLIDGLETTKRIRQNEKKYHKPAIPIIAVTAYAIEHDKKQCLDAGMNEYLTKPFKPEELLQIIDQL